MKPAVSILVLFAFLSACQPSTRIISTWRDPAVTVDTGHLSKFVVTALLKNPAVRRQVEDQMASLMPGKAVQSYKVFGENQSGEIGDRDSARLLSEGYDGIVLMRLDNIQTRQRYVPGAYPPYYGSWRGYWRYSAIGFYDPGYYTTDKQYDVEVNVYSLKRDKLIWTGTTSTVNPHGRAELFSAVSNTVYKRMKQEKFID